MNRVFVATSGPSDWRRFLADPEIQWKRGASALETAVSWESASKTARGLPLEIADAFDRVEQLSGSQLLLALPEHKVKLKGRGRASQNDVWALLRAKSGLISMAVEGKAGEPFASTLADWLSDKPDGKKQRLAFLCETLQIASDPPMELRYQLFHRTASAILEAQRFGASTAVMMVQSFRADDQAWRDFSEFALLLGSTARRGAVVKTACSGPISTFVGWVDSVPASDDQIATSI